MSWYGWRCPACGNAATFHLAAFDAVTTAALKALADAQHEALAPACQGAAAFVTLAQLEAGRQSARAASRALSK